MLSLVSATSFVTDAVPCVHIWVIRAVTARADFIVSHYRPCDFSHVIYFYFYFLKTIRFSKTIPVSQQSRDVNPPSGLCPQQWHDPCSLQTIFKTNSTINTLPWLPHSSERTSRAINATHLQTRTFSGEPGYVKWSDAEMRIGRLWPHYGASP